MPSPQVAVADIIKMLQATNQRSISTTELYHRVDELFRLAGKTDQALNEGLAQAYKNVNPCRETTSSQHSTKRQKTDTKTDTKTASEEPGFLPTGFSANKEPDAVIRCVCKSDFDAGTPWICCEKCSVSQHMNCMRLPWSAEEAEKQHYLCEKCDPKRHWEVLTMLKEGMWESLPFKSIEDDMDLWEGEPEVKSEENNTMVKALQREKEAKAFEQRHHRTRQPNGYNSDATEDIHKLENVPKLGLVRWRGQDHPSGHSISRRRLGQRSPQNSHC